MKEDNLKPIQSVEEARALGSKGGKKSGEVRRQRALLRDELLAILDLPAKGSKKKTTRRYIAEKLVEACDTDIIRAFQVIRDTIGEKPKETVAFADTNEVTGIQIKFVDKSHSAKEERDPKIVGEYTRPLNTEE